MNPQLSKESIKNQNGAIGGSRRKLEILPSEVIHSQQMATPRNKVEEILKISEDPGRAATNQSINNINSNIAGA
jgi:hypothetical protein